MNIPDNYDQFSEKERREKAWLDSLPVCETCCKPIQDEHLYLINDEFVCQKCLDRDFRKDTDDYIQ